VAHSGAAINAPRSGCFFSFRFFGSVLGIQFTPLPPAPPPTDAEDDHDAARRAVAMVREGKAANLMKSHLHTDVFLSAVVPWAA
jgi:hypothetical protein